MASGCSHCTGYVCITLKVVALIMHLVALAIPYWYKGITTEETNASGGTLKSTIREGLWRKCHDLESSTATESTCDSNEFTTAINAIRWLMFVGAGFIGLGVLASGAAHMEKNTTAYITGAVFGFIAAALNVVATVLYATVVRDDIGFDLYHLYAGWALAVVSVIITLLASLLALCLARLVRKPAKVEDNNAGDSGDKKGGKKGDKKGDK